MAYTRDWEESNPDGTEDVSLGDNRIRNLKVELGERLEDLLCGFNVSDGTGDEGTAGVKKLNFKEQSSIATPSANQITLAAKEGSDGDAKAQIFGKDEDGNERQFTKTSGSGLRLNVKAGDYAADSIDEDDIQLANNAALTAKNQVGDGTVNLISAGTNDLPTLPNSAEMASNAAPTEDEGIVNKKYVDDTYLTGQAVQVVNTQTGAAATGTTVMVNDDTIPQKTEGDEYMTLAITPTNASNKLKIEVVLFVSSSAGARKFMALFQDATADALAAADAYQGATEMHTMMLTHYMTAGTTSSTTFKVRAGGLSGTMTFNGESGGRKLGGVMASSITITEIKV